MDTESKEALLPEHDSHIDDDGLPTIRRHGLYKFALPIWQVHSVLGLFALSIILNFILLINFLSNNELTCPEPISR